ncbi:MAG: hypothetical protein Q4A16_09700 [Lautropia sp.]|nr:hypothetical protein [Lautropia sp.]
MTVDLNVLGCFGINLYTNISPALSKASSNVWDTDGAIESMRFDQDRKRGRKWR